MEKFWYRLTQFRLEKKPVKTWKREREKERGREREKCTCNHWR